MLLFAGWDGDYITPHDDQWHEYPKGQHGKYAKDEVYVLEGKYS
jgi:hypothetical protein